MGYACALPSTSSHTPVNWHPRPVSKHAKAVSGSQLCSWQGDVFSASCTAGQQVAVALQIQEDAIHWRRKQQEHAPNFYVKACIPWPVSQVPVQLLYREHAVRIPRCQRRGRWPLLCRMNYQAIAPVVQVEQSSCG